MKILSLSILFGFIFLGLSFSSEKQELSISGIGVAFAEGHYVSEGNEIRIFTVTGIVPGGAASQEGSIGNDDILLGIVKKNEVISFSQLSLADVVKLIRGKTGSRITLIIQKKKKGGYKFVDLKRGKITLQK